LPATKDLAVKLKLPVEKGVYVISVYPGSPAEKAGLVGGGKDDSNEPKEGGDLVTAIDSTKVTAVQDLITYLNGKSPGEKVALTVLRAGQTITVPVELEAWPDKLVVSNESGQFPDEDGSGFDFGPFHFRVK